MSEVRGIGVQIPFSHPPLTHNSSVSGNKKEDKPQKRETTVREQENPRKKGVQVPGVRSGGLDGLHRPPRGAQACRAGVSACSQLQEIKGAWPQKPLQKQPGVLPLVSAGHVRLQVTENLTSLTEKQETKYGLPQLKSTEWLTSGMAVSRCSSKASLGCLLFQAGILQARGSQQLQAYVQCFSRAKRRLSHRTSNWKSGTDSHGVRLTLPGSCVHPSLNQSLWPQGDEML